VLVALAALLAVAAPADASRVELNWRAPAACPDAAAVRERLRRLAPELPAGPTVRVAAEVARRPAGFRLRLALRGPRLDDRRVIEAGECSSLADVTALLIALAVAPEEVAARMAPSDSPAPPAEASPRAVAPPDQVPEPPPTPSDASARDREPSKAAVVPAPGRTVPHAREGAPVPGRAEPPAREGAPIIKLGTPTGRAEAGPVGGAALDGSAPRASAPPRARAPVRGAVRLGGGGEIGGIPAWSPTAGLAVAVFRRAWRVELAGTYAARALAYQDPAGVGGRMLLAAGALRGCGVPRWRRLEFPICGGLELGFVRAVARGVTDPRPAGDLWIAAQLSSGLVWAPTRVLAVTFNLDVLVAIRRPGFHVASLGELARGEPVGLRPMIGFEARFP
jgi:hypothetical protein